jgi:hypothetical protein
MTLRTEARKIPRRALAVGLRIMPGNDRKA